MLTILSKDISSLKLMCFNFLLSKGSLEKINDTLLTLFKLESSYPLVDILTNSLLANVLI